jgi:hypothetical protein
VTFDASVEGLQNRAPERLGPVVASMEGDTTGENEATMRSSGPLSARRTIPLVFILGLSLLRARAS